MFDVPPKLWLPPKPAIIRAAEGDELKLAMPLLGTGGAAAARGLRPNVVDYGALTQITDYTGTTNIGDLTVSGGLAAAFDGNTNQTAQTGARHTTTAQYRYVGKGWGTQRRIGQVRWWSTTNEGGVVNGAYLKLFGKDTAPSNATDGTLLCTVTANNLGLSNNQQSQTLQVSDGMITTTKYNYHWITVDCTPVGNQEVQTAEVQFWAYAS